MSVVRTLIGNVKGPKGDAGSQGPQGVAGTIEIGSVQTVSYGSPASVTNSGTEEEAILDFQIPQGAPGATVTDMKNLVLGAITDSTADYPAFAVNETGSTIFGKIRKFLSDLKTNYVSKAMMTTSTDVDTAGQAVADAKAIKSLNDSLSNCATKTELTNRTVDQTAGNTLTIDTSMTGVRVSSTETDFVVLLPFIAKNRNYSVNLTFFSITNIGSSALSNATVTDKRFTTFRIQYAGDASIPLANGIFTITFA